MSTTSSPQELGFLVEPVEVGTTIHRSYTVGPEMVTHHIPDHPAVLMTPNLIALFEDTAADIVRPWLATGAAAVGTWVGVRHTGAAFLGEQVDVEATVTEVEGRRIGYQVAARVAERRIGHGEIGFTLIRPTP